MRTHATQYIQAALDKVRYREQRHFQPMWQSTHKIDCLNLYNFPSVELENCYMHYMDMCGLPVKPCVKYELPPYEHMCKEVSNMCDERSRRDYRVQ